MTSLTLYELADQLKQLEALSLDAEIPPDVLRDTLEGLSGEFEDKAVAVAKYVLALEANSAAVEAAAKAMKLRADRIQRRADSVRHYLLMQLQAVDRRKIDTAELVIARRNNPAAVQFIDIEKVPAKFWVQPEPPPMRPDKKAIKEALQAGEDVPGAYIESGERVEIRL